MVFVYVLESIQNNSWYVGMAYDVEARLKEHNRGKSQYTKAFAPWKIIYFEPFPNWEEARIREKYFKTQAGKKFLRKKLFGDDYLTA